MPDPKDSPEQQPPASSTPEEVVISSRQLFGDKREIWIEHEGVRYRLRITRKNKLILQK